MGAYVTILESKIDKIHIDENEFRKWLDSKNKIWWNDNYGLCCTGEYEDQDDESDVKSHISKKIEEFNIEGTICSDGCVGTLLALCGMICEFLKETEKCVEAYDRELYTSDHLYIVR